MLITDMISFIQWSSSDFDIVVASCSSVLFLKCGFSGKAQKILSGFAGGVMVAASVWSLIIPAIDQASYMGKWSFVPAVIGFWIGIIMLLALDKLIPHMHLDL